MGSNPDQIKAAQRLQAALLEDFERRLKEGTLTPTDRATLTRLLMSNGWSLDPHTIPQGLRGVLPELKEDPRLVDDEDIAH